MSKRVKSWARARRARLLYILGGRCAACGTDEQLTFDCIDPMGDSHHRGSTDQRVSFYTRQMRAGNVQVLCQHCNSLKADLSNHIFQSAVSMARVRAAACPAVPSPVQGSGSIAANIRYHLSDIVSVYAEVGDRANFG
jgi:hypothetical protein